MSDITKTSFNYAELPTETALELRLSAERIRTRMKRTAEDIVEIGKDLAESQYKLANHGNGKFLVWIKEEFDMGKSTAYQFIQVFERFGNKDLPNFGQTSLSILYLLASPTDNIRETVIAQVQSGEISPSVKEVKAAIAEAKEQERIAREAQAQAEAQNRTLQQQLLEADQSTKTQVMAAQNRVYAIDRQLKALQQEVADYTPQVVTETVEVVPPAITAKVAQLEADLLAAKAERDRMNQIATQLQQEAREQLLRDRANADDQQIRNLWFRYYSNSVKALRTVETELPAPSTLTAWEPVDWQRLRELCELSKKVTQHMEFLLQDTTLTVIDAE